MSDTANPAPAAPPQPQEAPKTLTQKLTKWATTIFGIIIAIIGVLKLSDTFMLPSCASSRSSDTLTSIFKSKDVEVTGITDQKTVTDTMSEKTCTAHVKAPKEEANIDYKIFWDGWSAKVMITKVN